MKKNEIIEKVNHLLVEEFEIEPELLVPEALLKQDLEIDSLDFVDIVVLIDREFGFKPALVARVVLFSTRFGASQFVSVSSYSWSQSGASYSGCVSQFLPLWESHC